MQNNKRAFTVIELLAVIFLGCLLTSLIAPLLHRKKPQESWEVFHESLNQLAHFARQEAIAKRKVYRLVFDQKHNKQGSIFIEEEYQDPEDAEKKKYRTIKSDYMPTRLALQDGRSLRAVYLGKRNVLSEQEPSAFCYVIPDGMMQPVTVQVAKVNKSAEEIVLFQLNPFLGSFDRYEGKLKPE